MTEKTFLGLLGAASEDGPPRLEVILAAIGDEEWIANLLYWRARGDLDSARIKEILDRVLQEGGAERDPAAEVAGGAG